MFTKLFQILLISVFIYSSETFGDSKPSAVVETVVGSVSIQENKTEKGVKKGDKLPLSGTIKVGSSAKLEIKYKGQKFSLGGGVEKKLEELLSWEGLMKPVTTTNVSGVRSLYEDTLNQLSELSKEQFDSFPNKIKDHKGWKSIIDKGFKKLTLNSGKPPFPIQYAIINNSSFNAGAFPGGQFIVFTGTLDTIDSRIEAEVKKNKKLKSSDLREGYIAAILSHELAHYYNQHALQSIQRNFKLQNSAVVSEVESDLQNLSYSQENELDADLSGMALLQKSGYNHSYLIKVLEMMKDIDQKSKSKTEDRSIPFFSSHPSPRERLSKIEPEKELHKILANLENIFGKIAVGGTETELVKIVEELDAIIEKDIFKNNLELKKARAICLHKIWIAKTSLELLKLKALIDIPSFRESMVFGTNDQGKKGNDNEIPNIEEYSRAKEAYEEIIAENPEPYFLSNYSTLLAYSSDTPDRELAETLAKSAMQKKTSIQIWNNLAIVLVLIGKNEEALENLKSFVSLLNPDLIPVPPKSSINEVQQNTNNFQNHIKAMRKFDPRYVPEEFTPVLNLSLLYIEMGKLEEAKKLAKEYVSLYDNESEWAKYLITSTKIDPPEEELVKSEIKIEGIKIGSPEKDIKKKWGNNAIISKLGDKEIYSFEEKSAKLTVANGEVVQIEIEGENSPKIDKLQIGTGEKETIETVGVKGKKSNGFMNYRTPTQAIALQFSGGLLNKVVLYKR